MYLTRFLKGSVAALASLAINLIVALAIVTPPNSDRSGSGGVSLSDTPYYEEINEAAHDSNIDPLLLAAVVKQESNFDKDAVSSAGASGLGQLMPIIIDYCGISDPFVPRQNLSCSAMFLSELLEKYDSVELALAAYNAGEPAVDRCMCVPVNGQTEIYVRKVMANYRSYSDAGPILRAPYDRYKIVGGWHGSVAGYYGYDFVAGCGELIFSPVDGYISYNGRDGYVGPHSKGQENTMLVIADESTGIDVTLFHGDFTGISGQVRQGEIVGMEASIGNSTGCHTHMSVTVDGKNIDFMEAIE